MDLVAALHRAIPAIVRAGAMVRAEFLRPDGPRGGGDKAPIDTEVELFLCDALRAIVPSPFVGEETPPLLEGDPTYCWLVDPQDGTSEFLRGALGSSVSVALLRDRLPVLGIVHAPLSPDRGSDLIAWAEGMDHLLRNGAPVRPDFAGRGLGPDEVVLLAYRSYARPETNARRVGPARFMASNSVAYRLARVAAGDGVATASRQAKLAAYDYAAGHALLRGAGAAFVDGAGRDPVYGPDGTGGMDKCFAGAPDAVRDLLGHDWSLGDPPETPLPERVTLHWPRSDRGVDRAIGCLAGLAIGEGPPPDGLAGQPGPAMEAALRLARGLLAGRGDPPDGLAGDAIAGVAPLGLRAARPDLPAAETAFLAAISRGVAGGTRAEMAAQAEQAAPGGVPGALRDALDRLVAGATIADIAGRSAIAGALIGAAEGRAGLPDAAFRLVLSCRALASQGARLPRPAEAWADDLPVLAEALLRPVA